MDSLRLSINLRIFIISVLAVTAFSVLYLFRELDNNNLVSWNWVFLKVNVSVVYTAFIPALILAYMVSHHSFPDRYPSLFLFLSCFAAASLFWIEPEINVDTARYFSQAKYLAVYGVMNYFSEWGKQIGAWTDLPLIPFLYGVIFKIVGEYRLAIQIFITTLFSMTAVLTYLIGKSLWDKETGLRAGTFLLGIPHLLVLTPLMNSDVPTMFFMTLAVYACIKALMDGGLWLTALLPLAVFFAFFSKFSTWPMLSIMPVLVFSLNDCRPGRKRAVFGSIATALIFCLIVVMLKADIFLEQFRLLASFQAPGLTRSTENCLTPFFFQSHPFIAAASAYSVYAAFRNKDRKYMAIAWLPALAFLFGIKRIRYLLPLLPMVAIMASYGLREIKEKTVRNYIVFCVAALSLALALFAYLPFTLKLTSMNLKDAGRFLDSIDAKTAEVLVLPQKNTEINPAVSVPMLDLFTHTKIAYQEVRAFTAPADIIAASRFRFSWEYKNPPFYALERTAQDGEGAIVVISNESDSALPPEIEERIKNRPRSKVFDKDPALFAYETRVRVFW